MFNLNLDVNLCEVVGEVEMPELAQTDNSVDTGFGTVPTTLTGCTC